MKVSNFLTLFSLVLLMSCGDSDSDINPDNLLIGEWELQSFEANAESVTDFGGETFTSAFTVTGKDLDYVLSLDERTYETAGSYSVQGSTSVEGIDNGTFDAPLSDVAGNGTYTYADDIFTSTGALFSFEFEGMSFLQGQEEVSALVEKLTEQELILVQAGVETQSQTVGGVTTTVTSDINSKSVWKRK